MKNHSIDDNDIRGSNKNDPRASREYNEPPLPKREFGYDADSAQVRDDFTDRYHPNESAIPRYDHRHAKSYDGAERIEPPAHSRHTGSYDDSYYPARYDQPRMEEQQQIPQPNTQYNDSDYDSDGNLMTPDEKSLRLRHLQRQREYEERIAKWEQERLRKEAEEKEQQQLVEVEAERAYEVCDKIIVCYDENFTCKFCYWLSLLMNSIEHLDIIV